MGQQAQGKFKSRLLGCLGENASLATWRPSEQPRLRNKLTSKVVFLAGLKDAARMAVKVSEYHEEAIEEGNEERTWPHIQPPTTPKAMLSFQDDE